MAENNPSPLAIGAAGRIACFGELLLRMTATENRLVTQDGPLEVHVGGAEANVAVALACLGHGTTMISRLPDNPLGRKALEHLRRYGVETAGVGIGPGRMGLYFLASGAGLRPSRVLYDREHSAFARAEPADFDWDALLADVDLLHLSGISPALGQACADTAIAAARAARGKGARLSFDVNYRAQLWDAWDSMPQAVLHELVSQADILFGNGRDIGLLLGRAFDGDGQERDAALAAFEAFPRLQLIAGMRRRPVDVRNHRLSARIDSRAGVAQTEAVMVPDIVDRIGTGDAFVAGVLHALRTARGIEEAAQAGLALACLKHSLPGDACLFGIADIEAFRNGRIDVLR